MTDYKLIKKLAFEDKDYLVALRRHFHARPELSAKEYETAKKIEEELRKSGLNPKRVGETGVYAEINGELKGGKVIALRADTDALAVQEEGDKPYKSAVAGVSHACGHDAHTASLIGAARILAKNKKLFGGTVRLCFQQGEEYGIGAKIFIDEGCLDGADRCFGIHAASDVDDGKVAITKGATNASVDWFGVEITGKSAHITAPDKGADALLAAAKTAYAAKSVAENATQEPVLAGIGKLDAGTAYNAVAATARIEGTVRAFSQRARQAVRNALEELIALSCKERGCTAKTEWKDFTSPLVNCEKVTDEVRKTASGLFGAENVVTDRAASFGGDDFAEFILRVPGVYAFMGTRNPSLPDTCLPHHSSRFDIDENAVCNSAALYAAYAIDFLSGKNA